MDAYNLLNNSDQKEKIEISISEIIRENYERFKYGYRSTDDGSWTSLSNTEPNEIWERHRFIWGAMLHSIECTIVDGAKSIAQEMVWEWMHFAKKNFLNDLEELLKEKFIKEMEKLIEKEGKYPQEK